MASTHVKALKAASEGCTASSKSMSWHHLPSKILDKIFKKLPMSERAVMSRVCQKWRAVIHSEASRILNSIKQKHLVEDSQLASLGLDDDNHDVNTCICIAMAYEKSPFSLSTKVKGIKACTRFGNVAFVNNYWDCLTSCNACGVSSIQLQVCDRQHIPFQPFTFERATN
jgi:hypothetical protein